MTTTASTPTSTGDDDSSTPPGATATATSTVEGVGGGGGGYDDDDDKKKKKKLSVPIHSVIREAQRNHGLGPTGRDDYEQYGRYCSRRLRRLRRARETRGGRLGHGASSSSGGGGGGGGGGKGRGGRYVRRDYLSGPPPKPKPKPKPAKAEDDRKKKTEENKVGEGAGTSCEDEDGKDETEEEEEEDDPYADVTHENYLLVLLASAERSWSHAMQLKTELDERRRRSSSAGKKGSASTTLGTTGEKKNSSLGKIRHHFLARLRRAAHYATGLEAASASTADDDTIVEARAYGSWMRGNLALEMEDWARGCEEYGNALAICRVLGDGERSGGVEMGLLEMRDYFSSRAENWIEPVLRFCQYELQEGGENQAKILQLMEEQQRRAAEEATGGGTTSSAETNALLKARLDGIRMENRRSEASKTSGRYATVEYRDETVRVDSEELRVALLRIDELRSRLSSEEEQRRGASGGGDEDRGNEGGDGAGGDGGDGTFIDLLTAYDDAVGIVSSSLRDLEGMASGQQVNARKADQRCLLGYVKFGKLSLLMERNERMVNDLRAGEEAGTDLPSAGGAGDGGGTKRVEEIAHMYDALLQDARVVANLPGPAGSSGGDEEGGGGVEVEDEFSLVANAHVLRFRALKCYYVARMYARNSEFKEALVLLDHSKSLASQASEELVACELPSELVESMAQLERAISSAKCHAQGGALLAGVDKKTGAGQPSSSSGMSLLHRLGDYDSGHQGSVGDSYHLADIPPALEPIPCKPAFFDIALNHVGAMPDLQKHIDAHQQSKGILGWFRRG